MKKIDKEINVKSTTENLAVIRDFVIRTAKESGFPEDTSRKLALAVDEACTNVIKHAYGYSPEGDIRVNIRFDSLKFTVSITDNGSHFDPEIVPEPDIREYQRQKKSGGLGMYLMKKLMDEVEYKNLADNHNQVVLVKYL